MLCKRYVLTAALGVCAVCASVSRAQLPVVTLSALKPTGGQIGTTFDVTAAGIADGDGLGRLLFSHPGIKAVAKTTPSPLGGGKTDVVPNVFTVTIGADVPPGVYDARVVGTFGVSNPRAFAVDQWKEIEEPAGNQTPETAAATEIGSVVNAVAAANGEDWFKFAAKKGQRVIVDVWAQRIDSKMDATLVVFDGSGRELARSRDANRRDPLVDLTIPADGEYRIKVYDFTYGGGADYFYRLVVHAGPYVDFVFPPVVRTGQKNKLAVYGRNLPGGKPIEGTTIDGRPLERLDVELDVPADEPTDRRAAPALVRSSESLVNAREYRLKTSAGRSNGAVLGYAVDPIVVEQEPNDAPEQAQKVTVPCEFVGQFTPRGDTDGVVFDAKKGDAVVLEIVSQRMAFTADPFVVVQQLTKGPDGKPALKDVKELDDETKTPAGQAFDVATSDPYFQFTAPEDGTYRVVLRDLYGDSRGDPRLIYRLALRKPRPDFRLAVLPVAVGIDKNVNGQSYKAVGTYVRSGEIGAVTVAALRQDGFAGEIRIRAEGLPPGVTSSEAVIGPGVENALLTFAVPETAAAWCGPIQITGRATIDGKEIAHAARSVTITGPGGQRSPAQGRLAQEFLLAVGGDEKTACTVVLGQGKPLEATKGGKLQVPIKVTRRDNFKEPLTLTAVGLPPNVKAANVTIAGGASEGTLVVEPANNAAVGEFSIAVATQVKVNYARDKAGADAAMKTKQEIEKAAAEATAAAEAAKKAAAAAPKEKKAEADKAAAEAAAKAATAAAALKAAQAQADAKMKAAAPKQINNVPVVSTNVVVRVVEPPKKDEKTAKK